MERPLPKSALCLDQCEYVNDDEACACKVVEEFGMHQRRKLTPKLGRRHPILAIYVRSEANSTVANWVLSPNSAKKTVLNTAKKIF